MEMSSEDKAGGMRWHVITELFIKNKKALEKRMKFTSCRHPIKLQANLARNVRGVQGNHWYWCLCGQVSVIRAEMRGAVGRKVVMWDDGQTREEDADPEPARPPSPGGGNDDGDSDSDEDYHDDDPPGMMPPPATPTRP